MLKTELKLENVMKVYKGNAEGCRCGCGGDYFYPEAHQATGSQDRGYPVEDKDINDAVVKRAFNKIMKNWELCEFGGDYIDLTLGTRATTLYLVPKE